jgi:hypothetical protein
MYISGIWIYAFVAFTVRKSPNCSQELLKEYLVIGIAIIALFCVFFILSSNRKKLPHTFSQRTHVQAFEAYQLKDTMKKNLISLIDSVRLRAYGYRMHADIMDPTLENGNYKPDNCDKCNIGPISKELDSIDIRDSTVTMLKRDLGSLKKDVNIMLRYDSALMKTKNSNLYHAIEIYKLSVYLSEYANTINNHKTEWINKRWAKLLNDLQFKSLIWFQFLILVGLALWLKMQIEYKVLVNVKSYKVPIYKDNISQVKSLTMLLFVLIIPWFKKIDDKTVDTEKPFLTVSVSSLLNSAPPPTANVQTECCNDTAHESSFVINIVDNVRSRDTVVLKNRDTIYCACYPNYILPPGLKLNDSLMQKINTSIKATDSTRDLVIAVAKRSIGNLSDRDINNIFKKVQTPTKPK